ncbi:MAG: hypothetical protein J1F33_03210 [Clostridiales bacterium]|nr:hypothetical protein [Clostridiales bacterium]
MIGEPVNDADEIPNEGDSPEKDGKSEAKVDARKVKKKKKVKYIDDGHTVYSMEGLDEARGIKRRDDSIKLTRKEKWAAIRAAFARFLPIFLGVVACFSLTALLLYFWLRG